MKRLLYPLLFLIACLGLGCKTTQPIRPVESYLEDNRYTTERSTIRIPIRIDLTQVQRSLNEQFSGVLYEDDSFSDGDNLKVTATKDGSIELTAEGNAINYGVPLDLAIQYDLGLGVVRANGRLQLDFATSYSISEDWQLTTNTRLRSHEWKERPRVALGAVSIPVQSIANLVINKGAVTISTQIDTLVAESFQLDTAVQEAWQMMFDPIEVSPEFQTWLVVRPTDLGMTPVKTEPKMIEATIVVESEPELLFGPRPIVAEPTTLPPFRYRFLPETAEAGFQIFLNTTLSYDDAERLTRDNLVGERFEQGKRYVVVEDVQLYGQGNKLVVDLELSGSYKGKIYLVGEPVFDARRNRIEIENLEYSLDTKNVLFRSAAWLAQGTIKRKIQENMDYLLDYNLQEARNQMQEQLADYELREGIKMQGELETLDIYNAYLTENGFKVVVAIEGALGINIEGLAK